MNYAIILAGGIGSRFWPLSRESDPKQFLNILSNKSLLEETLKRISPVIKKENIYIAANIKHKDKLKKYVKIFDIPVENLFFEPKGKNTLAPIAGLSKIISLQDNHALIAVLPSDHYIANNGKFIKSFSQGIQIAKSGSIATFGILPLRPETGYGYIKTAIKKNGAVSKSDIGYKVEKFIEKPLLSTANKFLGEKTYFWNSGIFIFAANTILKEIHKFLPQTHQIIKEINSHQDCIKLWKYLPSISIDYALLEKTSRAVMLPLECGWTDLGNWQSVSEMIKKDKEGNIFKGTCLDKGSKDIFVHAKNRIIATIGLEKIIIIDTDDALLICPKNKAQEVKKIVELLKQKKLGKYT